jgi:hypothetical protein
MRMLVPVQRVDILRTGKSIRNDVELLRFIGPKGFLGLRQAGIADSQLASKLTQPFRKVLGARAMGGRQRNIQPTAALPIKLKNPSRRSVTSCPLTGRIFGDQSQMNRQPKAAA